MVFIIIRGGEAAGTMATPLTDIMDTTVMAGIIHGITTDIIMLPDLITITGLVVPLVVQQQEQL